MLSLTVFSDLLSVAVLHARNDLTVTYSQSAVCAVKGSTVYLHCYAQPPQDMIWVVGYGSVDLKADRKYSGRVQYYYKFYYYTGRRTTVKISDLRESDSAEYKCRVSPQQPGVESTGSPGVSLLVTGDVAFLLLSSIWRLILTDLMLLLLRQMSRPPGEGQQHELRQVEKTWMCQQLSLIWIELLHLVQKWTGNSRGKNFHVMVRTLV